MERRSYPRTLGEIRSFLQAWNAHWSLHEYGEPVHVRSGWVICSADTLESGRGTRLSRLSTDGRTDVLHESSWLDDEVAVFINRDRFPLYCTPPAEQQPANRTQEEGNENGVEDASDLSADVTMTPVGNLANTPVPTPDQDRGPNGQDLRSITLGVQRLNAS